MQTIDICPQQVYTFEAKSDLTSDIESLVKQESYALNGNQTNYMSVNNRLNKDERYKNFVDWVENSCLQKIVKKYNYECEKFSITQMWANRADYGNWHQGHHHPYSYISGVFYVTESNSSTWFSMTNHWSTITLGKTEFSIDRFTKNDNQLIHKEPSVPGKLIIFPSHMYHSVDEHLIRENPRYTLSFNSMPSGRIGNFYLLAGLDITVN